MQEDRTVSVNGQEAAIEHRLPEHNDRDPVAILDGQAHQVVVHRSANIQLKATSQRDAFEDHHWGPESISGEPINTRHSRIFSSRRGSRHRPSSAARNVRRMLSRQTYKIARTAVLKTPHEASC